MKLRFNASASNTSGENVVVERLKMLLLVSSISGKSNHEKQLSSPFSWLAVKSMGTSCKIVVIVLCICIYCY